MINRVIGLWLLRKSSKGFTLTEMIIATLISLIVITGLLSAMVQLIDTDRQEGILTQTQQDMERALKYISNDIKESVYVYDFTQPGPPPMAGLPNFGAGVTPIIAFWKMVPLSDTKLFLLNSGQANQCENLSNTVAIPEVAPVTTVPATTPPDVRSLRGECVALRNRRNMYSLVVYLQTANSDPQWKGQSRIMRYELSKYDPNGSLVTRNPGFIDPSYSANMTTWPNDGSGNNLQTSTPGGTPTVLVDFVDSPTSTADANLPACDATPSTTAFLPPPPVPLIPYSNETRVPSDATNNTSFFVCVKTVARRVGDNQNVKIYLRGNADGQPGVNVIPGTYNTVVSPLQTTVTLRGVIDKSN
jgi:prepilin-type N-terminal cleavage/methylation domain-containing protein